MGDTLFLKGDFEESKKCLVGSLKLFDELDSKVLEVYLLRRLGQLAKQGDDHRRAARLFGAYKGLRESLIGPLVRRVHLLVAEELERFSKSSEELEEEWKKGQKMTLEHAVEYALQVSPTDCLSLSDMK
jgi:hypothetical protein